MKLHTKRVGVGLPAIALSVAALPLTLFGGAGVAAADDYAGQTYADATAALGDAGLKPVIATRSGDSLADDDCVVTSSQQAPWLKGDDFAPVSDTVLLNLNCSAGVATATKPGSSAGSPEGRAALQAAKEEAEQDQATAAADQNKAKH